MNRNFILILIFSFSFSRESGFSIYSGLNLANIRCNNCESETLKDFAFAPRFFIGGQKKIDDYIVGAGISGRGTIEKHSDGVTGTNSFVYLDLHAIKLFPYGPGLVFTGLGLGVKLSAVRKVDGCAEINDFCGEFDIEDVGIDYGILLGYIYSINKKINIFSTYYYGLVNIEDQSNAKHTGVGLGISYGI